MSNTFTIAAVQMKIAPGPRDRTSRRPRPLSPTPRSKGRRSSACRSCSPATTSARRKTRRSSTSPSRSPGRVGAGSRRRRRRTSVVVVGSLFEKRMAGVYHNTATVHDANGRVARPLPQDAHPGRPAVPREVLLHAGRPRASRCSRRRPAKVGTLVCWDQWYPEAARLTALQGAEVIFYPTAIGWHPREKAEFGEAQHSAWETSMRGHAIANGTYVLRGQSRRARGHRRRGAGVLGRVVRLATRSAAS